MPHPDPASSPYVRAEDVKPGDVLVTDGGFTCMSEGEEKVVQRDERGELFIPCADGRHFLEGQLGYTPETKGLYVGLTAKRSATSIEDGTVGSAPGTSVDDLVCASHGQWAAELGVG